MTPNKLPPLPPSIFRDDIPKGYAVYTATQMRAYATAHAESTQAKLDALMLEWCQHEMTPEQLANWAAHQMPMPAEEAEKVAEALRQSQSMPAGAVAWLESEPGTDIAELHNQDHPLHYYRSCIVHIGARQPAKKQEENVLFPLYAALQADAREKGEAVAIDGSAWPKGLVSFAQGYNVVAVTVPDGLALDFPALRDGGHIQFVPHPATQPAQASEASFVAGDRVVWTSKFGHSFNGVVHAVNQPIPATYVIKLDDGCVATGVTADCLATSSQETASE